MKQRTRMKLEEKLQHQQQELLFQQKRIQDQTKAIQQMLEAEDPLFKDICPSCGGKECTCERWDWYGEKDYFEEDV